MNKTITILAVLVFTATKSVNAQTVKVSGAMRNVMQKGELFGTITLDTLFKTHLYGLGPMEYLSGELLILDGTVYRSTVVSSKEMKVKVDPNARAPFFVYTHVPRWVEQQLPDSILTIRQLEAYLHNRWGKLGPFPFRLSGYFPEARIHVVNLPKGTVVKSPEDAHQGQQDYVLNNAKAEVLGFFSTEHKAVFTHHNTFLHLHLIKEDRASMGHLDDAKFEKGIKIFLPEGLN
jgi:acetolactate decarboxylase